MTRRERLENRLEKRREWAAKAEDRQATACETAHRISERFEMGQPVLVGHHSEGKALRDQARMHSQMSKAVEAGELAKTHESKAANIEAALERTVFSDDADAIEKLNARIAEHEKQADRMKAINKSYKAHHGDVTEMVADGIIDERMAATIEQTLKACPWDKVPFPAYQLSNLRARIRTDKKRLEEVADRQQRMDAANASETGYAVLYRNGWALVTFPERPADDVLESLRGAGYVYRDGSWYGDATKLPERFGSKV
jgi:nitrogen fixation protein/uncharacterized coiled-coil protein SlyX